MPKPCTCISIYTQTFVFVCTHTHIHTDTHTHTHASMRTKYAQSHRYMFKCMHTCIHTYTHIHSCMHELCILTYIKTHIFTHAHMHTCTYAATIHLHGRMPMKRLLDRRWKSYLQWHKHRIESCTYAIYPSYCMLWSPFHDSGPRMVCIWHVYVCMFTFIYT